MSESQKNRLWSLLLVCTFAVVLSVFNKSMDSLSDNTMSSETAFGDNFIWKVTSLQKKKRTKISQQKVEAVFEEVDDF